MAHRSPPPTIPQCCAGHRLAVLDALEALLTNDALTSFDRMAEGGWPRDAALDALRHGYRQWVLARFADAIDLGLDLIELEVAA